MWPAAPVVATNDASELYLSHRALIDQTINAVSRRNRVSYADTEDFRSIAHMHVIDDDYAVLRAYQGRADIAAFLHAVIRRLFQDWRNANWGRWRPSASVRRDGAVAIQLETLLVRDRRPLHEAIETLRTNCGVTMSPAELEALAATFPARAMRRFVTEDELGATPNDSASEYASASAGVDRAESASAAEKISTALAAALDGLPPQDQLILRMRFENNAPVSTISRVLGLDQQPLYRRLDRLRARLRATLEQAGVGADEARDALQRGGFDLLEGGRS
jgi:RNA polymerase sigma factor (sigma-70 family)